METRQLGRRGPQVSAIGFGAMSIGIADVYTSSVRDDEAAVALIHRALDLGVTLIDTADVYGNSELQVGKALKGRRDGRRARHQVRIRQPASGRGGAHRRQPRRMSAGPATRR